MKKLDEETTAQRRRRHMKVAAMSSASGVATKAGHVHATARALRDQKEDGSPEGFDSQP